jgi:hypothetical protein
MQVDLYIYGDKYINDSSPFTADTTLITADTDLYTADATISGGIEGFYEVAQKIELYNDEKINLTSSIQDISDISKAKTDFTQSFTIPASQKNNVIFKHWYENAIDNGFDQRVKYRGFIEINTIPFRYGGFSLDQVKFKDNKPESYTIKFFGDAKSIKDVLKEDKLSSLDFSDLNHSFTSAEVVSRITSGSADVAYPIFAHDRIFSYNDASLTDITTEEGAINYNTLFPAVSLATILQKINTKYGLEFTGAFTNYVQFSKLWMLFKNAESLVVKTAPLKVDFTFKDSDLNDTELNITTDEIGFRPISPPVRLRIRITPTVGTTPYDVLIYKNGVLFNSFLNQLGTTNNEFFFSSINSQNVNDKYTIYVQSNLPITFTSQLFYFRLISGGTALSANGTSQTTQSFINIANYAPELKLIDLINGLIKMFNLVIIPNSSSSFDLIPLELYYNNGRYRDITANLITDDHEIKKVSTYKNISFNYQDSENILNNKFNELFTPQRGFKYGDLMYEQIDSLESNNFKVDLPFENPIYERESDSNLQIVTFKDKSLNNYVPKPILMYDNGQQGLSTAIKIKNPDSSFTDVSTYRRFSNDIDNGGLITLNWGEEVSQWFLNVASEGLYKRHYSNYLGNIFNIKGRLLSYKCKFNPVELTSIKLNDRIVIRDKRYTINKLSADLTTGETSMELLTDYRTGEVSIGNRYAVQDAYFVNNESQTLDVLMLASGFDEFDTATSFATWLTYTVDTFTQNTNLSVIIDANTTGIERTGTIRAKYTRVGEVIDIEIPIIQSANILFGSTETFWGDNLITFNN